MARHASDERAVATMVSVGSATTEGYESEPRGVSQSLLNITSETWYGGARSANGKGRCPGGFGLLSFPYGGYS
jgi:hypothetical protein